MGEAALTGTASAYPKWSDRLIHQIDAFVAHRSRKKQIPALVLVREDGGDPRAPAFLIREYADRLRGKGRGSTSLVPHAIIDDIGLDFIDGLDKVARRFQQTMPSGKLHLPAFRTCRAVLRLEREAGNPDAQQQKILDGLYDDLLDRRSGLSRAARLAKFGNQGLGGSLVTFVAAVVAAVVVGLPKAVYKFHLRHGGLRWVADELGVPCFLDAALEFSQDGLFTRDDPLVRRILLRALLNDLRRAVRDRSPLSHGRARRRWAFVLLLPRIEDRDGAGRAILSAFAELAVDEPSPALLILAACAGTPPDYAIDAGTDLTRPNGVADRVFSLLHEDNSEPVCLVRLPRDDDEEHIAQQRLLNRQAVNPRRDRTADWIRPALPLLLIAVVVAAFTIPGRHRTPPSLPGCVAVPTGERVGVTDGAQCSLAVPGPRDDELRALEKQAAQQNAKVTGTRYMSVVFLAPLSLQANVSDAPPTGLQMLFGVLTQQAKLNAQPRMNKMPLKVLIANTGQYFQYGARNDHQPTEPDAAQMIIDRQQQDHIAAVLGLTQSRPQSLRASQELDAAQITTIATGVSGSTMVGPQSPQRYFQISAPDTRVAPVIADFVQHSPDVQALTSKHPHAVVVDDPDDTYFSKDLTTLFVRAYQRHDDKPIDEITFNEKPGSKRPEDIAAEICDRVAATHGIIVYLGRSGVLPDLLNAMQNAGGKCQPPQGSTIPLIVESTPIEFQTKPQNTARMYPSLSIFYETTNAPTADTRDPYAQFASSFRQFFPDRSADADAAAGYDAVGIADQVIESLVPSSGTSEIRPDAVYHWLNDHGLTYPGASGQLHLDSDHKFPPDKAVFVRGIRPGTGEVVALLSCGLLPDQQNPDRWGNAGHTFPCVRD
jgi:ABC-type branched-subunit amino acid transport system substrate-binding protein